MIISNQEKSKEQIIKLRNYITKVSIDNIPRNQFGRCNRQKVLTKLDIKGSKDHPEIKESFRLLDEKLGKAPKKTIRRKDNDEQVKQLQKEINELEKRIAVISSELHTYKKHDGLIKHLIATGAFVK